MTYPEALRYLGSFINYEKKDSYDYKKSFKLDRMRKLCALLGDPQNGIKAIHIAGTKGKGSVSAITHSILRSAGFKTGLYTSPHLVSFCERIRVNDLLISEEALARILGKMKDLLEDMRKKDAPSFFEVYTALAYLYFKENNVDFAVYEVGLGGRLDATNVIEPLVCAITPISYEHTDKLGDTLTAIAIEKAGIIKNKSICVVAPQEKEAEAAITKVCRAKDARALFVGKDIEFEELAADDKKERFNIRGIFGNYLDLEMGLLGAHQVANAATAVGIIEALRLRGITISADNIRKGIKHARWEGRLEVVGRKPFIILDGAQNRASANALRTSIIRLFRYKKMVLVLGVSKDKDIRGILEELSPLGDSLILTKAKVIDRAAEPSVLKKAVNPGYEKLTITSNVEEAIKKALSSAEPDDLILVTGSLFVVGEAREILLKNTAPFEPAYLNL